MKIEKTLLIFGAGASKADGAPIQRELFSEIMEILTNGDPELELNFDILQDVKSFLKLLFPFKIFSNKKGNYPTFEEITGLIYFAINRDQTFKGISNKKLKYYLESLIALIAIILNSKLRYIFKTVNRKFIKSLYNTFNNKYPNENFGDIFSFLNINYDILLDNALFDLEIDHQLKVDYCFNNKLSSNLNKIKLFKPHGSLNWFHCKACNHIMAYEYEKFAMRYFHSFFLKNNIYNLKCPQCGSNCTPIIIPPTFFKEFHNILLTNILNSLENHLHNVKNLIFIGYSFPDADLHLKYIFKKAQLIGKFQKIILINKEGKDKSWLFNIERFFPNVFIEDLTWEIKEGLCFESIEKLIEKIFTNLEFDLE